MTSHPTDEVVNRYRCGPVGVTVQDVGVGRIQFNQVSNATRSVGIGKARSSALTAITNPLSWPTLTVSIVLALGFWFLAAGYWRCVHCRRLWFAPMRLQPFGSVVAFTGAKGNRIHPATRLHLGSARC